MIPRELIDAIRDRADLVEIVGQTLSLTRKGNSYVGLCPFHNEKTPSFNVVPSKGIYHCFGCGEGGDVFQWLMQTQGMGFNEAVKDLGQRVGVTIEERQLTDEERGRIKVRTDLYEICDLASQHFQAVLRTRPEGEPARRYLTQRGISEDIWERYHLGYAPPAWSDLVDTLRGQGVDAALAVKAGLARSNGDRSYDLFRGRVTIPIQDARGRIVAFGGRHLEDLPGRKDGDPAPKYVNSPETPIYQKSHTLYALSHARPAIQRKHRAIIVEGYFDVLSLHQAGFTEAVATCGTALTTEHLSVLRKLTRSVVALFDSDSAGVRAALKSLDMFVAAGVEARRLDLGDDKDPDEFIQKRGAEAFERALQTTETLFDTALREYRQQFGTTPEGSRQVLHQLAPTMRRVEGAARSAMVERISKALQIGDNVVREYIGLSARSRLPSAPAPTPIRFRGTRELNHLLWLLLHHSQQVAGLVAQVDPLLITNRLDVARVIARLLAGDDLGAILQGVDDPDLAQVLRACAVEKRTVRDGKAEVLYTADRAGDAARQMLARLQLRQVEGEISALQAEVESCGFGADGSRYRDALVKKSSLVAHRQDLLRIITRKPNH
ncbi:MAG: DNA primase [Oligoflexia bacterium]|nr:DNA primase [Oligoflexia bacterium]